MSKIGERGIERHGKASGLFDRPVQLRGQTCLLSASASAQVGKRFVYLPCRHRISYFDSRCRCDQRKSASALSSDSENRESAEKKMSPPTADRASQHAHRIQNPKTTLEIRCGQPDSRYSATVARIFPMSSEAGGSATETVISGFILLNCSKRSAAARSSAKAADGRMPPLSPFGHRGGILIQEVGEKVCLVFGLCDARCRGQGHEALHLFGIVWRPIFLRRHLVCLSILHTLAC